MKLRVRLGLAALCLLSGSGWLLREWQPEPLPALPSIALHSGLLAGAFWALHRGRGSRTSHLPPATLAALLGWFVLLAGLPTVVVVGAAEHLSPLTETLVFALVPVFVVFFSSQNEVAFGLRESPLRLLVPALVGVAGAALLLPFHLPPSVAGQVWLGILLVAAATCAWAAVQLHRRITGVAVLPAAAIFSASIFLLSAPFCFAVRDQFAFRHAAGRAAALPLELFPLLLLDGPVTLLTVWLLRELPPVAFSARYPLVIAVTVAEGYLLLRPETNWTTGLGVLLLLFSGAWLLEGGAREVP